MYLDPGFGGMLIQIIVALVAAGGVAVFALRKKISALFSGKKNSKQTNATTQKTVDNNDDFIDTMAKDK